MSSLFDTHIANAVSNYMNSADFKAWLRLRVKWAIQGLEPGYKLTDRERFTETVARRIRKNARRPIYFLGRRIWRARCPWEFCRNEAERIVSDFLRDEKIRFGDPRYDWNNGHDLADDDMSYWECCP